MQYQYLTGSVDSVGPLRRSSLQELKRQHERAIGIVKQQADVEAEPGGCAGIYRTH